MGCRFASGKFVFDYVSMDALSYQKFRTRDKQWWITPAGAKLHLWNIDNLRGLGSKPTLPLVITEGEADCIAVYQACGGYVTSIPNGANGRKSEGAIYRRRILGSSISGLQMAGSFQRSSSSTKSFSRRMGMKRAFWFVTNWPSALARADAGSSNIQKAAKTRTTFFASTGQKRSRKW